MNFRFGSSTLTSSTSRPLTANFVRNNTDLGFSGPVLKYERFDPPPVNITNETNNESNLYEPSYNSDTNVVNRDTRNTRMSLDAARPAPLDLDLMSDLEDIINRKTSPLESSLNPNASQFPSTNGHTKISKSQLESVSDLILLSNGNNGHKINSEQTGKNAEVIFDPLLHSHEHVM